MRSPHLVNDPRFTYVERRMIHQKPLESWTATIKTSKLLDILDENDIPSAPVLNIAQVAANRHNYWCPVV